MPGLHRRGGAAPHRAAAYYDRLLDDDTVRELRHAEGIGPVMRRVVRQMGADGWLGIGWPTEYGGQGRGPIEQFIFFDESMRAGAPVPMLTINSVHRRSWSSAATSRRTPSSPRSSRARSTSASATASPNAGTDLALSTRAVSDGDKYMITGQKIWTSLASDADYCWLAVRTDAEAQQHRGISIFIAPMDAGHRAHAAEPAVVHDICSVY